MPQSIYFLYLYLHFDTADIVSRDLTIRDTFLYNISTNDTKTSNMAWIARGQSSFVQDTPDGHTSAVPAVATHRGSLWCLWSDPSGDLYYAIGDNDTFQTRIRFPDQGIPVMADLLGRLHAVVVRADGEIAHYEYNDVDKDWSLPTILDKRSGLWTNTTPSLISHNNNLMLVYIQDAYLYYSTWTLDSEDQPVWKYPQEVSGISKVSGVPALFVLNGDLHVLCASSDESRLILGFKYSLPEDVWNSCDDVSEGKAAQGVSATSYGDSAFLAFQENGPGDTSHVIYMSEYKDGMWHPQEAIAGQTSFDPPQLAVLNGRVNCIFNSNDESRELLWYSRPLLDYSLSSWMAEIADDTLLSDMTIPGTHDSCAESNIPFVRTQYLSIAAQLTAGIRFLDLRVRVHSDGQLYMYHGGIPINLPFYLKFDFVMQEVFDFLSQHSQETVLVSINNDDKSDKEPPSTFYSAVAKHITSIPPYPSGQPRWITSNSPSILGDARGKAVLLRRYKCEEDLAPEEKMGLDLSGWLDNNPDFTLETESGVTVHLQDKWQYSDIIPLKRLVESKYEFVVHLLEKARDGAREEWFINFMSAVGDPVQKGEVAESHWIAVGAHSKLIGAFVQGMNPTVRSKFDWGIKKRYGIIPMDYPELPKDSDLVALMIGCNM
ncbi:hypothetical protein EYC80_003881 [Monilinia laxa]|uniref:Phosphatidylinositol-specific phospholipase C X domain-containing protein n=1 Tax=Monilinia laxa TaxID=61186 RepID=A0A5N6KLC2_MONLA|nr:hypothetical protein EYC80_003881 [Monilinia laxa]